ncbi:hypothetical protein AAVH_42628, partial [Aphelenchoides avenae]
MTLDSTSSSLSHAEWRSVVYGPFFNISLGTLVVNEKSARPKKPSAVGRIFRFVAPILVGLPVLARTIYLLFGCLSTTYLFSKNWAINFALALFSVHGFVSLLFLNSLNSQNYFNEFTQRFALVLKNKSSSSPPARFTKAHVLMTIFFAFYVYTCIFYGVENVLDYEELTSKANHTAKFRNSMFGNQSLWIADVLIQVWSAFLSATVLVLYFLTNNAL